MLSIPEVFIDNSPMPYGTSVPVKQPSARKSLRYFSETLDVKLKTDFCRLWADKSNWKAIRAGIML